MVALSLWGNNGSGRCNVPEPNTDFIAIAAGYNHSLGLKRDGTIVAWGANDYGVCNVPEPNTGFIGIAAGYFHNLALREDGSIVAWGANSGHQCDVPEPNTGFIAIAAGYGHSLGLKGDGSIVAWGDNWYGQCNVPKPNTGFIAIATGYGHSLGLKQDGSIVAWGENYYGQCDVPEPNTGFVAIAAGGVHSLAIRDDKIAPSWTLGIFQSSVLYNQLHIYFVPSEPLSSTPNLIACQDTLTVSHLYTKEADLYFGSKWLSQSGQCQITVSGSDLCGNVGGATRVLNVGFLDEAPYELLSPDGRLHLMWQEGEDRAAVVTYLMSEKGDLALLGSGSVWDSGILGDSPHLLGSPIVGDFELGEILSTYYLGPQGYRLRNPARVRILIGSEAASFGSIAIAQAQEGGWKLLPTEISGNFAYATIEELGNLSIVVASNQQAPTTPSLAILPNPATSVVRFSVQVPHEDHGLWLKIYDVRGSLVRTLLRDFPEGNYQVEWDGVDSHGRGVAPGIYFVDLRTRRSHYTHKVVITR